MKKIIILFIVVLVNQNLFACTLFWANKNDQVLCTKNMDWSNTDARMLFIPASEGKYGRVYFGIESEYGFTNTSGMNEMGLWYGGATLPVRTDIYNTYNKPRWDYELSEKIMEECATVDEAIAVLTEFWEPHWDGHSLIADKYGNCVVVEYGENDVVFIRNDKDFQVMTNFYLSDTINSRWYDCYRYNIANEILANSSEISFDLFRNIAEETHADGDLQTCLTNIHDLTTGDIQLYYMRNFNEVLKINLFNELEKGEHYLKCSNYFEKIKLCNPYNGAKVSSNNIKISWTGESDSYYLQYSIYNDFTEYEEIEYAIKKDEYQQAAISSYFLIIPFLCIMFLIKKRKKMILVFILVIFISQFSCDEVEIEPQYSQNNHEIIISNLDSVTTYYWKILSMDDEYPSESVVSQFKTL